MALAEYLAISGQPPPRSGRVPGIPPGGERGGVDVEMSFKGLLRVYRRAIHLLTEKRERFLLTEALGDLGDLHVSGASPSPYRYCRWKQKLQNWRGMHAGFRGRNGPPLVCSGLGRRHFSPK